MLIEFFLNWLLNCLYMHKTIILHPVIETSKLELISKLAKTLETMSFSDIQHHLVLLLEYYLPQLLQDQPHLHHSYS